MNKCSYNAVKYLRISKISDNKEALKRNSLYQVIINLFTRQQPQPRDSQTPQINQNAGIIGFARELPAPISPVQS